MVALGKYGLLGGGIQAVFELLCVDFFSPNCFLQLIECLFLAGLQILHHLLIVAESFIDSFQLFSSNGLKLLRFALDQVDILPLKGRNSLRRLYAMPDEGRTCLSRHKLIHFLYF